MIYHAPIYYAWHDGDKSSIDYNNIANIEIITIYNAIIYSFNSGPSVITDNALAQLTDLYLHQSRESSWCGEYFWGNVPYKLQMYVGMELSSFLVPTLLNQNTRPQDIITILNMYKSSGNAWPFIISAYPMTNVPILSMPKAHVLI